jgi:hypothetical protein
MIVLLHISADQYRGTNDSFPPVEIPWLALGDGRNGAKAVGPAGIGPSAQFEGGNSLRRNGGAYAPRSLNFQTGMPSRLALSARSSWMPV